MTEQKNILFEEKHDANNHKVGIIILNRPQALNALSYDMFVALESKLFQWAKAESIKAVIIKSSSEKAFSAGGDIRAVYEKRGKPIADMVKYFSLEYKINQMIYHFPKPYISLLNGITMGGGVGISLHGSHTVGTEKLKFAMPETLIGFFPDVGATYRLSRLPNFVGFYLGLTGQTIGVADAAELGLVKHAVSSDSLSALEQKLVDTPFAPGDYDAVDSIIAEFETPVGVGEIAAHEAEINRCFPFFRAEKIIDELQNGSAWARLVAEVLLQRSPISLKVALKQLHAAREKTFDDVIGMDYRIACEFLQGHEFYEGIRAAVIDKDRQPSWQPNTLVEVTDQQVDRYFN